MGETYVFRPWPDCCRALVRDQGRDDEALIYSKIAEAATSADDDIESQALWRSIRAPIEARAGNLALAEELALAQSNSPVAPRPRACRPTRFRNLRPCCAWLAKTPKPAEPIAEAI